jgi:hypothetical protein
MAANQVHAHDSPLSTHAHQLLRLDQMMAEGQDDSEQADALRDQMDVSWYQMSPDELEIARQLSADLYTLHDDSLVRHPREFGIYSPELAADLASAVKSGDYLRALRSMQDKATEISVDRAALFRAIFYRALGLPEIALVFFNQVADPGTAPGSTNLPLLGFLWQHVNLDTAVAAASAGQFAYFPIENTK